MQWVAVVGVGRGDRLGRVLYQAWQRRGWFQFQLPLRFRGAVAVELRCDGAVQPRPIRALQAQTGIPADDDTRVQHVALGPLGLGSLAQPAYLIFCSQPNTTLMARWGVLCRPSRRDSDAVASACCAESSGHVRTTQPRTAGLQGCRLLSPSNAT